MEDDINDQDDQDDQYYTEKDIKDNNNPYNFTEEYKSQIYNLYIGIVNLTDGEMRQCMKMDYKPTLPPTFFREFTKRKWLIHPFEVFNEKIILLPSSSSSSLPSQSNVYREEQDYFEYVKKELDFFIKHTAINRKRIKIFVTKTL